MGTVAVLARASGRSETTVDRALAARPGVAFVEVDALAHDAAAGRA